MLFGVPEEFVDLEMCMIAMTADIKNYIHVPLKYKDEELNMWYVGQKYSSLNKVPKDRRTEKVCEIAVRRYGGNMKYVPDHLKSKMLLI